MALQWILTRSAEDNLSLKESLASEGINAHSLPCIERIFLGWPDLLPAGLRWVIVTSSEVARQVGQRWPNPADRPLFATIMGRTRQRLLDQGFAVRVSADGVVAVAEAVSRNAISGPVFYPTSDQAINRPEHHLALAKLQVVGPTTVAIVYKTAPPAGLRHNFISLDLNRYGLLLASPSAAENFYAHCYRTDHRPTVIVCFGRSTLNRWHQLAGPGGAVLCDDMLAGVVAATKGNL